MNSNSSSQSGKGSKPRPYNLRKFEEGYEEIEWRERGTFCEECGRTFRPEDERLFDTDNSAKCVHCNWN
jgi:hypothetical protein